MAIVSIVGTKPSYTMESNNSSFSASTGIAALPVLAEKTIGAMMQAEGIATHNFTPQSALLELLKHSSHVSGTLGSPGTFALLPLNDSNGSYINYEAIIVNQRGDATLRQVRQFVGGFMVGNDATIFKTVDALASSLIHGLEDTLGGLCHGIPFFDQETITLCMDKLSQSQPGTYAVFAHAPFTEIAKNNPSIEAKRNVIVWVGADGKLERAQFHYAAEQKTWRNGGPHHGTPVLTAPTLKELIEKKIELTVGANVTPRIVSL